TPVHHGLAPAVLAAKIRSAYPEHRLVQLFLPTAPKRAARARLEGADSRLVFVHPGTGAILAIQEAAQQDWLGFIYALHQGKPLGLAGKMIASSSGVLLLILWLIGLRLWWQH